MIKRGKEWSWMNKLDYSNHYYNEGKEILKKDTEKDWCHYSGMPSPNAYKETNMERKKRKRKRSFKIKFIRFFQNEVVIDWLIFLIFISGFLTLIYLSAPSI